MSDELHGLIAVGRHQMPAAWQRILPEEFLWARAPDERLATCASCYKVARGEFRADCQCCTYFPQIPSFMLGLALADPRSQKRVERIIREGHTLPLGMQASPAKLRVAVEAYADDRFGNEPAMVCPFVEAGTFDCAVYPYRNSICSTYFCAYDHGDAGEAYWYKAQTLVGHTEVALSQWALDQVGLDAARVLERMDAWAERVPATIDTTTGGWSAEFRRDLFGEWLGRERELFGACAELLTADGLFEAACAQPFLEPLAFDRAVRAWMPEDIRESAPEVADEPGLTTPIATLWYEMQLTTKRLWALPFNEGRVALAAGTRVEPSGEAFAIANLEPPRPLTRAQERALHLFAEPRVLGEKLLARPELEALGDTRGFLAECMRRGVLVTV